MHSDGFAEFPNCAEVSGYMRVIYVHLKKLAMEDFQRFWKYIFSSEVLLGIRRL